MKHDFIPCTREISIADDIHYRPIRSWHTGVYAGEKLESVGGDSSGCMRRVMFNNREWEGTIDVPLTYTHRVYWNTKDESKSISAFLSYPNAMGCPKEYFWEIYGHGCEDTMRFFGDNAEAEMEMKIIACLGGE